MNDQMPVAIDAERTILGAVLLDPSALIEAQEKLHSDDMSLDSHKRIFLRMLDLQRRGISVDIITLQQIMGRDEIEAVGGVAYIASLTEGLPMRPAIGEYIRIVKEKSLLRRVMLISSAVYNRAMNEQDAAGRIISDVISQLQDAEQSNSQDSDLESVGQWLTVNDVFAERKAGIFTGIDDYDDLTYGIHPGELTVVGARTAMGKTSHAGTLTWQIAKRGKCAAVFLNEQQKASFVGRMLCARGNVPFKPYRRGTLDWIERQYIEDAVKEFRAMPIFWDSRTTMSVASIANKSRRLKRSEELDVIVIDQLSGVSNEGFWEKGKRGDEIVGDKVRAIKAVAMDLNVPVVLYHQLNRASLKNKDSRPTLADLQDSGKIEQIADNVDFLHRPGYYDPKSEDADEIIHAKCRDGETGIVRCKFVPWCCKWENRK